MAPCCRPGASQRAQDLVAWVPNRLIWKRPGPRRIERVGLISLTVAASKPDVLCKTDHPDSDRMSRQEALQATGITQHTGLSGGATGEVNQSERKKQAQHYTTPRIELG